MDHVLEQIKKHEDDKHVPGERFYPYVDSVGKTTIGWGRNLSDVGISEYEAEALLSVDLAQVETEVRAAFPWLSSTNNVRYYAFVELAFNMGTAKLMGFKKMLAAAKQGEWNHAADELLKSRYAKQVGKRAQVLARQLLTGEWKEMNQT